MIASFPEKLDMILIIIILEKEKEDKKQSEQPQIRTGRHTIVEDILFFIGKQHNIV